MWAWTLAIQASPTRQSPPRSSNRPVGVVINPISECSRLVGRKDHGRIGRRARLSRRRQGRGFHPVRGGAVLHRSRWPGSAPRWSRSRTRRRGDPGRRLRPGKPDNDPWYFHQFNANKKSLTINLKSPRGLEIVKELLKKADVTVENMAPGTIERLGLGYDEVKKINPGIIYCQVKGFGTGSPYEKSLAFDMIAQAAGGPISVTGEADRPPVKPGPSLWRHRHRHADGDQHPRRAATSGSQDRPGPAPAGGDAGRDDPLHARAVLAHPADRQGAAARRQRRSQPGGLAPVGALPVQAGRAQRLRLYLLPAAPTPSTGSA